MALQTPPPPSISPRQMTLMRIVAAMAWSDGNLATEEAELMLDRFSGLFARTAERQVSLRQELRDYLMQNLPLEELVPQLQSQDERELVLKLGYQVISSSTRTPEESSINAEEAAALQKLINLLDLPESAVTRLEQEAQAELSEGSNVVDWMANQLQAFMQS